MASFFEQAEWTNAVNTLRQKASDFNQLFNRILETESTAILIPNLHNDFNSLVNRGRLVKSTISKTTQAIDTAYSTAKNMLNGINLGSINGLGFIPLIPIAVITGAIAAITYWINDAVKYLDKTNQIDTLTQQGLQPDHAYELVYGSQFSIKQIIPWIIGGTISILLVPRLIKMIRG